MADQSFTEAECKEAFALFDKDGDGLISTKELATVMRALGAFPSDAEADKLAEGNANGTVDVRGFVKIMEKQAKVKVTEKDLIAAFAVFEKDGKGFIAASELKHLMTNLGEKLSEEEVDEMLKDANVTDNKLTKDSFVKVLLPK